MKKAKKVPVMNNIEELKKRNKMSYNQIAKAAGVSESYICQLAKGERRNPSFSKMERIAFAFESSAAKVFKMGKIPEIMS